MAGGRPLFPLRMARPLPTVTAQYPICLTEARPEEAVVAIWLRQATSFPALWVGVTGCSYLLISDRNGLATKMRW
jgi:hypothetical protein